MVAAGEVGAAGARATYRVTRGAVLTFVNVDAAFEWVPGVSWLAGTCVVARIILAEGIHSAGVRMSTFINICTLHLSIAFETRPTFTQEVRG